MNILLWVVVTVSIALVCFAVAKQTGFKIPSLPSNKWVRRGITASAVLVVVAILFPNAVSTIAEDTIGWAKDFDENYGKARVNEPAHSSAATPVVKPAEIISVQLTIPVDETVFIAPPHGYRLSSALCPPENVMEVTDNHGGVLRQIDCAGRITLEEAELHGRKFAFFQKQGASQPSVVIVRWVKIS